MLIVPVSIRQQVFVGVVCLGLASWAWDVFEHTRGSQAVVALAFSIGLTFLSARAFYNGARILWARLSTIFGGRRW